jgi:uncharacterized peroxidase-related enzyme
VTLDESLVKTIKKNYLDADLTRRERIMLDYVAKVTLSPTSVSVEDIESLRQIDFSDQGILQINLIASWFNYINRVADGLGVGRRDGIESISDSQNEASKVVP